MADDLDAALALPPAPAEESEGELPAISPALTVHLHHLAARLCFSFVLRLNLATAANFAPTSSHSRPMQPARLIPAMIAGQMLPATPVTRSRVERQVVMQLMVIARTVMLLLGGGGQGRSLARGGRRLQRRPRPSRQRRQLGGSASGKPPWTMKPVT